MKGIIVKKADKLITDSYLFGNPRVNDGFVWPSIEEDNQNYDLKFLCQIDCHELLTYYPNSNLPEKGILSFFYDLDEMPKNVEEATQWVHYFEEDELHEMILTDEKGHLLNCHPQAIQFEILTNYEILDDWVLLLAIDSIENDEVKINFNDILCFYIQEESLKQKDFSKIKIKQMSF